MNSRTFFMTMNKPRQRQRPYPRLRQRGLVLEIVLVVLVTLMLASIALFRSVDTSSTVSSNVAFKNDAGNRAQLAFDQVYSWLNNPTTFGTYVSNGTDCPGCNYSSQMLQTDARGLPNIITGSVTAFDAAYTFTPPASALMNTNEMKVRYLIERLCTRSGPAGPAYCTMSSLGRNKDGSQIYNDPNLAGKPILRVTVRVDGPRNTVSYAQATITP